LSPTQQSEGVARPQVHGIVDEARKQKSPSFIHFKQIAGSLGWH